MDGISSKTFGGIQNKEKTFQGQQFDTDLGINYVQFRWRNHDPQIGRFIEIDPLSTKFAHNSTYAFSENRVITHIELEGLEAVRTDEYDKDGKLTKIVLEKNVVVLTKKTSDKYSDKKNANIIKKNNEKAEAIKKEFNLFYNGHNGDGAKTSTGVKVEFKFNVTQQPDVDKNLKGKERTKAFENIRDKNAIMGTADFGPVLGIGDRPVGATVITNDSPVQGDSFGQTVRDIMKLQSNGPQGKISHEMGHSLGLDDNGYDQGGVLHNPPQEVNKYEVDQIVNMSVYKKQK